MVQWKNRRCLHHFFHRVICRSTGWNGWWWEEYSTVGKCCQKHHLFRCPTFLHIFIFTPYLGKISDLTTIFKKLAGLKPPCFSFQRSKNWNGKQPTPSLHVWVAASFTKCNRHRKMSKIELSWMLLNFGWYRVQSNISVFSLLAVGSGCDYRNWKHDVLSFILCQQKWIFRKNDRIDSNLRHSLPPSQHFLLATTKIPS